MHSFRSLMKGPLSDQTTDESLFQSCLNGLIAVDWFQVALDYSLIRSYSYASSDQILCQMSYRIVLWMVVLVASRQMNVTLNYTCYDRLRNFESIYCPKAIFCLDTFLLSFV